MLRQRSMQSAGASLWRTNDQYVRAIFPSAHAEIL
jgi:hypothetical protein